MIFFYTATGDLIKQVPEKVYQGSNKANRIWFVCPTGATNVVNVAFKLPDGQYTPQIPMYSEVSVGDLIGNIVGGDMANVTSGTGIKGVLDEKGERYGVWYYEIPLSVTAYAGKVKAQFSITSLEETQFTQVVSFDVLPGVPPLVQDEFESQFEYVMTKIVELNNAIENLGGGISQEQLNEITNKINEKLSKTDLPNKIYGTNEKGEQVEYGTSSSAGAGKIVVYREDGRIKVVDGTSGSEAVNFRQLDKKYDKIKNVVFEERTDSEQSTRIMNGRVRSYSAPSAVDSYWAGIEPMGLTIHYVKSGEQSEDGGAIYHWHLKYPEENEWKGDTDILNTPPKTSGTLATLTDVANEIAKIVGGADSSYDTLKEIADWIKAHPNDASELASRISNLESGKLDKVTTAYDYSRLYGINTKGEQMLFTVSGTGVIQGGIVARLSASGEQGQIKVPENPTKDYHAISKKYLDLKVGDIETALDGIIAIQNSILGGNA